MKMEATRKALSLSELEALVILTDQWSDLKKKSIEMCLILQKINQFIVEWIKIMIHQTFFFFFCYVLNRLFSEFMDIYDD